MLIIFVKLTPDFVFMQTSRVPMPAERGMVNCRSPAASNEHTRSPLSVNTSIRYGVAEEARIIILPPEAVQRSQLLMPDPECLPAAKELGRMANALSE
jgi:hypothetical protein